MCSIAGILGAVHRPAGEQAVTQAYSLPDGCSETSLAACAATVPCTAKVGVEFKAVCG